MARRPTARITPCGSRTAFSSRRSAAVAPAASPVARPTFPNVFFTPPGPPIAAPFAGALTPTVGIPGGTLAANSAAVHGMAPNFVNPAAHEGEIAIERQLPGRMTVFRHLPVDARPSPARQLRCQRCARHHDEELRRSGRLPPARTALTATVPFYTARLDTGTGLILNQVSAINSWYNGLVLTLRKPMSHDVELLFNYTYSKAWTTARPQAQTALSLAPTACSTHTI